MLNLLNSTTLNRFVIKWGSLCYKNGQALQSEVALSQNRARVVIKLRKLQL